MAWTDRAQARSSDAVDPAVLLEPGNIGAVMDLLRTGALVSFGVSRDGGSMSCTITFDGAWDREWFRDPIVLGEWLMAAFAAIDEQRAKDAAVGGQRSSNGRPRRDR